MNTFRALFLQVLNRFNCKRNFIIYAIVLILFLIAVFTSINAYEKAVNSEKEFLKMEAENFKKLRNYDVYAQKGINIFFAPTPINILFTNPTVMSEIVARIDTVSTLDIHSNCQGKMLFQNSFKISPSTILFVLGSLLALFIGHGSLGDLEYLKSLASDTSEKAVYISIVLSRFILLTLSYLSIFSIGVCIMTLKGIYFNQSDLVGLTGFLTVSFFLLLFFFLLGTTIKKKQSQGFDIIVLLALWAILIFIIPWILDYLIEIKSNDIPSYYKVYNDKSTIVSNFEKKAEREKGKYIDNTPEGRKEVIESFWNNDYKIIEKNDYQFKEEFKKLIKLSNNLYNLLPSAFYLSTANEASGRGYQNFLDFYDYIQDLQRQFVRFWIDRVYYNDPKVMVNFIKGDENIFKAKSQLPFNFWLGIFINLGYCIVLLFLSYFLYLKNLFRLDKKNLPCTHVDLKIKSNQRIEITKDYTGFFPQILNVFFGQIKHFTGKISIDGEDIVTPVKKNFIYLPKHENFPDDLKTKHLISYYKQIFKLSKDECIELKKAAGKNNLNKYFVKLSKIEKTKLLLTVASFGKKKVVIIDDFGSGSTNNDRLEMMNLSSLLMHKNLVVMDICSLGIPWLSINANMSIAVANNAFVSKIESY